MINEPMILMLSKYEMKQIITKVQTTYNINHSTFKRYAEKRCLEKKVTTDGLLEF